MNNQDKYCQYNTISNTWLHEQVIDFINMYSNESILGPFAGQGHLLNVFNFENKFGYDIDKSLKYTFNDSLLHIPQTSSMIITNPPYLYKSSAKLKQSHNLSYFKDNTYNDLYQIALHNCLKAANYVVAIIPESFILNGDDQLNRCSSITIIEDNPFEDTECPVVVACFGPNEYKTKIYKNDKYVNELNMLIKIEPKLTHKIKFNVPKGKLGLRSIDGTKEDRIQFMLPEELNYDLDKISTASRMITTIDLDCDNLNKLIIEANQILNKYRMDMEDVLLASFKGNTKQGIRRRRLDFRTARGILEMALDNLCINQH